MTTILLALNASPVVTTASAPQMGYITPYSAAGGPLTVSLPALTNPACTVGAVAAVEKSSLDTSFNWITFNTAGSDTFDDGSTSTYCVRAGEKKYLQVVSVSGTKHWKLMGGYIPRGDGVVAAVSQVSITNTTTSTQIIAANAPVSLMTGSTYRVDMFGTYQTSNVASSSLTFTPFLVNTALAQTCSIPSQGVAVGPVSFYLSYVFTVRTAGTSGTAIAKPNGRVELPTAAYLSSVSAATTTINTNSTTTPIVGISAQWGAANASNSLLIEIATIERVI